MSRTGGVRYGWVDSTDGRWALAVAWAWGVERGHIAPMGDAASAVRADEQMAAGARRPIALEHQLGWALIAGGLDSVRAWRDLAGRAGSAVRGVARVLHLDTTRRQLLPSWWTEAGIRPLPDGRWEAVVGWHGSIQQAGEWPTRESALEAVRALRPWARITEYASAHPYTERGVT